MELSHFLTSGRIRTLSVLCVFLASFFFLSSNLYAHDSKNESIEVTNEEIGTKEKKGFNITEFIFHHIGDSHEFTIWGGDAEGKVKWVGLYLPVILYTDNGIVTFSSSEFERNDDATKIVEKKGQKFVKYHGKIYYADDITNSQGAYVNYNEDHKLSNARPLDFSITKNVFTILFTIALLFVVFTAVARGYKKNAGKAPKGVQSFFEPLILFVRDEIAIPNLGHKYERFMPYLLTVFFFIWFLNVLGLIPFFPGSANVTGNIAVTMVFAVFTMIIILFNGNKNYWGHIFNPPVPWWLKPLMIPVEIIGVFTKPFALMIRLFANITAGHILVLCLLCLPFLFNASVIAGGSVLFTIFIALIELLVAFIQAFIFTILSALFIGMAIDESSEH
ncbi:F0F1 ATP synthase subunit A [Sphingobacterium sp. UT-1RO-CII-1]|uniref:F0F1 ATP synthase subunit A n=1 Tax=Sphingobacterium sp. UT-1RO-CII-1 TaxID=2995225 RepID=UPI00227B2C73|nr:F0F1 ATP synthase subunit A [Sphingobacterium sp. UT-1RO-CII-1]MCY4779845.1 F0F1 ATP synthase subunit A [Sphingobacterium sp. UT-1RO-CII-1]